MTESEWLSSADPVAMLSHMTGTRPDPPGSGVRRGPWATDRKLRLFACACCRLAWAAPCPRCKGTGNAYPVVEDGSRYGRRVVDDCPACRGTGLAHAPDPRGVRAVEVSERYADGEATEGELDKALSECGELGEIWDGTPIQQANVVCFRLAGMGMPVPPAAQAALLREVFGNPWRPLKACLDQQYFERVPQRLDVPVLDLREVIRWNDGTVPRIARGIYGWWEKCKACRGTGTVIGEIGYWNHLCPDCHGAGGIMRPFNADDLPVLHDALLDAGADCEELLAHLRSPGPHVRGCWALDLVLGKQ